MKALQESSCSTLEVVTTGEFARMSSGRPANPLARMDEWKTDLWNLAGIPTPGNDHETNETIVFGYIVAWFLGEVSIVFFILSRANLCY